MRYAQGGGLTAEGRRRREQVRLAAVGKFERRVPVPEIAAELRVSERSVQRWRRAWEAGGLPGLASKGQAARCRLSGDQLAELDRVLDDLPRAFRTAYFAVNLRCGLPFNVFVVGLLRAPVLKPGVPTF